MLTWIGSPVGWLRQLVRVLSLGTVVVNVIAGWPEPVAVGLRAAAPLMLLAMLEAGRGALLRRIGEARGTRREPVPLIRWLLAPWRTVLLWRWMALWQVTSYRTAIDTELQLRRVITLLQARYGRRWWRHAPADLVWMLPTGVDIGEAGERVRELVGLDDDVGAATTIDRSRGGAFHGCYSVGEDTLWGVVRRKKSAANTLAALKSIRAARPDGAPIYVILDNLSAHRGQMIRTWAARNKVELCFTRPIRHGRTRSRHTSGRYAPSWSLAPTTPITPC